LYFFVHFCTYLYFFVHICTFLCIFSECPPLDQTTEFESSNAQENIQESPLKTTSTQNILTQNIQNSPKNIKKRQVNNQNDQLNIKISPTTLDILLKIGKKIEIKRDINIERKLIDKAVYVDQYVYNQKENKFEFLYTDAEKQKLSKTVDELIIESQTTKFMLLSDDAGTGKSTTFKNIAVRLKELYPTRWVQYVDLKAHTETFKAVKDEKKVEPILAAILNLNQLDFNVFLKLVEKDVAIFLWDGFDEISPTYSDFVLTMVYSISKSTKNVQWIATRPSSEGTLTDVFDCIVYQLFPYREEDNREFLRKFFQSKRLNETDLARAGDNVRKIIAKVENRCDFYII
jgi:energy-coupling factor transporter ATP-binding protein EcfA2